MGIRYEWQKDSSGNNIVIATMDSLISEIIKVTETTFGEDIEWKGSTRETRREFGGD